MPGSLLYNSIFELKNDCGGCSVTPAPSLTLDNCMVISGEKREYNSQINDTNEAQLIE